MSSIPGEGLEKDVVKDVVVCGGGRLAVSNGCRVGAIVAIQ